MNRLKNQGFTLALLAAAGIAFVIPEYGATGGALKSEITTKACIAIAFLFQGMSLKTRQILRSAINVRLHIFCQSWIFILAPLLMMLIVLIFGRWIHDGIQAGLLYLAVLPTTISSCIILTSSYKGDASAALFNATFSNIAGVFVTPLWCIALFANTSGEFPPLGSLISKISLLVLLPLAIGQILRPFLREQIASWQTFFTRASNGMIVFVVYVAFSNSVVNDLWNSFGWQAIAVALLFVTIFLLLLSALIWTTAELASRHFDQRVAVFFCSSQKTLAAGVPMAAIIFAGQSGVIQESFIILPIMLYHSLQLFLAGIIGPRIAAKVPVS